MSVPASLSKGCSELEEVGMKAFVATGNSSSNLQQQAGPPTNFKTTESVLQLQDDDDLFSIKFSGFTTKHCFNKRRLHFNAATRRL